MAKATHLLYSYWRPDAILTSLNHNVGDVNNDINTLLTIINSYCRYSLANLVWSTTVDKKELPSIRIGFAYAKCTDPDSLSFTFHTETL